VNKGTKIALIALAVLSLVCLIGVWSMFTNAKGALEKAKAEAVTEGNTILSLLCHDWLLEDVQLRTAPTLSVPQSSFDKWADEFGPLVGGDLKLVAFDVTPDLLIADLACTADFEDRKGDVMMKLTRSPGNAWELADFDVAPSP
jgi:hypothetical protein